MKIPTSCSVALAVCLAASLVSAIAAIAQNAPGNSSATDDESKIDGTWRGDSVCVEKGTSCHDEIAVYRISAIPGKHGHFMVTGGKVVGGKEVVMGSGDWRYDSQTHTLTGELPKGVITLKIDGNKIEGTYILPDKTVLRRITLKKSK
jgi:hypothetical protein